MKEYSRTTSLPSWERGLKSRPEVQRQRLCVAPLVGAWIEIATEAAEAENYLVAPLVGAWIEISHRKIFTRCVWSLPSWERGLKSGT